jgi:hypothetical protein
MSTTFHCPGGEAGFPEIWCNFSNVNANDILMLLGEEPSSSGQWEFEELPRIQGRLIRVMNVYRDREHLVSEPVDAGRVHYGGNTDEQTMRRLREIQCLVKFAQDEGRDVVWG